MDAPSLLFPGEISTLAAIAIIVLSFFTSALTAAFGIGGGLTLLAAMSLLFPPAAVVPVHGVAQLGSNFSRFWFLRPHLDPAIIGWFAAGAVLGAIVGGRVAITLPENYLRGGIALFILATVWLPRPKALTPGLASFFGTGVVATFLTMFFGATGPVVATMLNATKFDRMTVVATHSAAMVVQHGLKTLIFGVLGFAYGAWVPMIICILAAGAFGSYAGVKMLKGMPEDIFQTGTKAILTMIALYLIYAAFFG